LINIYNVENLIQRLVTEMNRKKIIIIISCLIIATILLAYLVISITMNKPTTVKHTTLYVDPQRTEREVGQDFFINISISNVTDLYGWQLQLSWNKTILDVVSETEGTFLRSRGTTFFYPIINATGYVKLDCNLVGNVSGVSGNGVLATIQFRVIGSGKCDLYLYETILVSSSEKSIVHTVKSGKFST
jgi:hypothetical protein